MQGSSLGMPKRRALSKEREGWTMLSHQRRQRTRSFCDRRTSGSGATAGTVVQGPDGIPRGASGDRARVRDAIFSEPRKEFDLEFRVVRPSAIRLGAALPCATPMGHIQHRHITRASQAKGVAKARAALRGFTTTCRTRWAPRRYISLWRSVFRRAARSARGRPSSGRAGPFAPRSNSFPNSSTSSARKRESCASSGSASISDHSHANASRIFGPPPTRNATVCRSWFRTETMPSSSSRIGRACGRSSPTCFPMR